MSPDTRAGEGMAALRTIYLGGHLLRIYASPLNGSDHPWASFNDLVGLVQMDDFSRTDWLDQMRCTIPDMIHEMTAGAFIVSEPVVGGMFQGWIDAGATSVRGWLDVWTRNWIELFAIQLAELPHDQWQKAACEAELRNLPKVIGTTVMH